MLHEIIRDLLDDIYEMRGLQVGVSLHEGAKFKDYFEIDIRLSIPIEKKEMNLKGIVL